MIRGHFDFRAFTRPMPRVRVALFLPGISVNWALVPFVVDTGASRTVLNPDDSFAVGIAAERLQDPSQWPDHRSAAGIGGMVTNYVHPAQYRFFRADQTSLTLSQEILIAGLTSATPRLPSLLGWDVLRHFRFCTDVRTGEVLLEE